MEQMQTVLWDQAVNISNYFQKSGLALLLRICGRQTLSCLCRCGGSAAKWAAERCHAKLSADGL